MLGLRFIRTVFNFSKGSNQKYGSYKETSYSRSSGPGGQNVNKVNSKAQIRFNLDTCDWIDQQTIDKIKLNQKNIINQQGEIVITSQVHRQQNKNLDECHKKLKKMIYTHSLVKKERIIAEYQQTSYDKQKRISDKKRKSEFKQNRRKPKFW